MTHTHLDHIGCFAEILKQLPWAELWSIGQKGISWRKEMRGVFTDGYVPGVLPGTTQAQAGAFKCQVNRKLEGGETLDLGDTAWEVIHIPGHSMGSIGLYHRSMKNSYSGGCCLCRFTRLAALSLRSQSG